MKDEFDDVTPDMFERVREKKVARPDMSARLKTMIDAQEGANTAEKVKNLKSTTQPGGQLNPLNNVISRLDEEGNRPAKAPARPFPRGGGAGTGGGSGGAELKSIMNPKSMKKGGKVSSASSRADGIAQRGKTKGRFV